MKAVVIAVLGEVYKFEGQYMVDVMCHLADIDNHIGTTIRSESSEGISKVVVGYEFEW